MKKCSGIGNSVKQTIIKPNPEYDELPPIRAIEPESEILFLKLRNVPPLERSKDANPPGSLEEETKMISSIQSNIYISTN